MYYSDKFKKDVVNRYLNGESVPKIHKDTGVSKSTRELQCPEQNIFILFC